MKTAFLFFFGLIAILSAFYPINPTELELSSFNQVFAQSEGKNKNFGDVITIHSSETITNEKTRIYNIQEKNFDDTIIIQSSDTASKEKPKENNGENKNFDEAILSASSDTSTIVNQNNTTSFKGRLPPSEFTKIHSAITHILENANPKVIAKIYGASVEDDLLYVYVHLAEKKIQTKSLEIEILAKDKNIIVSKLNLSQIQSLANLDSVEKITLPDYAVFYDHDESEGVSISMADSMHAAGFNGTGINVAVIDNSFFLNNTEISSRIIHSQLFDSGNDCAGDISCNMTVNGSHGTAVAEIVVDMAPDVNLLLYSIGNSVDFANAVDDAISKGADIITASLGFPTQAGDGIWYRDGTSSTAKKVNEAKNNGTLFTVAAGNQGDKHYSDFYVPIIATGLSGEFLNDFVALDFQSVMTFNSSAAGNMKACLPVTNNLGTFTFRWNGFPVTEQDYDFMLYDSTMEDFLNGSFVFQIGDVDSEPTEFFSSSTLGDSCIVVGSFNSTQNHLFHIEVANNTLNIPDNDIRRLGSIDTPADAIGAFSVGAINQATDFLEGFSSNGPTDDGRLKPEICGYDNTLSHQTAILPNGSTLNPFFGTSAAAPHVAGAAALLLEQTPTLTVDQLRQKLINDARFDADFSKDNLCGSDSGALAVASLTSCLDVPSSGTWTVEESCILDTNSSMDKLIVQTNSFLMLDPGITLDLSSSDSLSVKSGSSLLIKSGASISLTCKAPNSGDWIISSNCTLSASDVAPGNVTVENNALLTIPAGVTLDIDFENFDLLIKSGGSVLVKSGGKLN